MSQAMRVLILSAHADDCEFFAGGLVAKLAKAGAEIVEVIATDNGRGSYELDQAELIAQSREREAKAAAKLLGKKEVHFLGHPDGFLDEFPKNELRKIYIEWIRRFRPDILMSFDLFAPYEPHPDHRHVAMAALEAFEFAKMPLFHPEQVQAGLLPHLTPTAYWFAKDNQNANHIEDISDSIEDKIAALDVHESQIRAMMTDLQQTLKATGRHQELIPLLDPDNYRPALEVLIRQWAESVGKSAGFAYAEAYRLQRADDLFNNALG